MKNWIRKKLIELIGDHIDQIARDSYNDGCYFTAQKMRQERAIEFHHMMAENEKLREIAFKNVSLQMPEIFIPIDPVTDSEGQ